MKNSVLWNDKQGENKKKLQDAGVQFEETSASTIKILDVELPRRVYFKAESVIEDLNK